MEAWARIVEILESVGFGMSDGAKEVEADGNEDPEFTRIGRGIMEEWERGRGFRSGLRRVDTAEEEES